MASSTLALPISYHNSTPSIPKSKLETNKVRSEDELLKFFLHGSYDVQRGNTRTSQVEENKDKTMCIQDEKKPIPNINPDDQKSKSRFMFEETYMINISVKQPDKTPSSKQIDVRIEKAASDTQIPHAKIHDDEISSIFDEDDNTDEVNSVIYNEINSSSSSPQVSRTKLTLADMINKTLTTIPATSVDNLNKITKNTNWFVDQKNVIKTRKTSEEVLPSKPTEKIMKTPSPLSVQPQPPTLTSNISEDEKLFEYLDYLDTKEESNQSRQPSNISITTKNSKSASSVSKPLSKQEPIPIIDLEQLCRSLTVNDLKDEFIRKQIYDLKILIDERHKKVKSQIPLIKSRKDNLPILIAMPPVAQQRRRTTVVQPTTLLHSKTGSLQAPYNSNYHDIISNYNNKQSTPSNNQQYTQRQIPQLNTNRKYQYT